MFGSTMFGNNFDESVRKVLDSAQHCSAARRHEYIGTEHILLALLNEPNATSSTVLRNLRVDSATTIAAIDAVVPQGKDEKSAEYLRPYTSRAKKALELSMEEARDQRHSYVGTEHLLLGLILEERGIAAQLLAQAGATLAVARAEVRRVIHKVGGVQ